MQDAVIRVAVMTVGCALLFPVLARVPALRARIGMSARSAALFGLVIGLVSSLGGEVARVLLHALPPH